jgi:hypothetical protein
MNAGAELLGTSVEAIEPSSLTTQCSERALVKKFFMVAMVISCIEIVGRSMNLSQRLLKWLYEAIGKRPLLPLLILIAF